MQAIFRADYNALITTENFHLEHTMKAEFTANAKRDDKWWLGWVEEIPGANARVKTKEPLVVSLRQAEKPTLFSCANFT